MENYKLIKTIFSVVLLSGLLSSCKNADTVGVAVQPPGDQLHLLYSDTNELFTTTIHDAPVVASSTTIDINKTKIFINLLGDYNDPVFGSAQASFYTQFVLNDSLKAFPVKPTNFNRYQNSYSGFKVEKVVLSLGYYNLYGDSQAIHSVEVYRLTDAIDRTASYSSSKKFNIDSSLTLAHAVFKPHLNDSVNITGVKEAPQLKMPLDTMITIKIQSAIDKSPHTSLGSLTDIISGIYVKSTTSHGPGEGSVVYFDLGSASTSICIYYHFYAHIRDSKLPGFETDSLVKQRQDLSVNGACARLTHFSTSETKTVIDAINTPHTGDSILFLKSLGVSRIKILMPFLKTYFNKGYVINKAELQVFVDPSSSANIKFPPADYLVVSRIGDANESLPIADRIESSNFGGSYNAASQLYSFTITRHIQSLLNGKLPNNGLYLEFGADQKTGNAGRVLLSGGKKSNRRMRLLLTYTKI